MAYKSKEKLKAWQKANPEKLKVYRKIYREKHKEKIKALREACHKANPEKRKAQSKARYLVNSEKEKARNKAHYKANPEKVKTWNKAWRDANPEKNRDYTRKRRALKRTTQIEPISEKIVYLRDGWICQHCKKRVNKELKWPHPKSPSLDHIIPLNKGGTHTYKNVQLAHLLCNMSKKDTLLPEGEQLRIF